MSSFRTLHARRRALAALIPALALLLAGAGRGAVAQTAPAPTLPHQGPLTLGAAARLAAAQSAGSEAARFRTAQARARLTQSRSALLPTVSALASQNQRTFNTASFGISFPSAPASPRSSTRTGRSPAR
jgi:outer membrane protein TolC